MSASNRFLMLTVLVALNAHAADPTKIPESGPTDSRLTIMHDVDHPASFTPYTDKAAWEVRRQELRTQILVAEGLWPMPAKTPLNPVIWGKIDRDEYTIEHVFFASLPGHYASGNLYRPKNKTGKLPGVLCPHGHWPGGRLQEIADAAAKKEIDSGAETTMEAAKHILQARCAMLARMGCVVFHYDMIGYADATKPIGHREGFTDVDAELRLQTFMGLQTWNSIRSLDFLTSLPDVDPSRLACTGASGGGTQTMILGAIDDRLTVEFPAVMPSVAMQGGCICENSSLLRVGTNNIEFTSLFAPKPAAMTSANDWTVDLETKGLPEMKAMWALYGAPQNVTARHYAFPHNYNQVSRELMYNWFNEHLKLGYPSPVKEKPFVPVPPKELSVYDAEHPLPSDAADAATLRKYMTDSSDKQMADLAEDPAEYRKVVGAALRAMVSDKLPAAGEIEARKDDNPLVPITINYLSRRGTAEAVPSHFSPPADWDGTVVVLAEPLGIAAPFNGDGAKLAKALFDRHMAVLTANLFATTGALPHDMSPVARPNAPGRYAGRSYAGYYFGYNRSILANRVHDLLTLIRYAKDQPGVKRIHLIGTGSMGPAALLARAIAGDAIDNAAIDLNGFDFDQVKSLTDDMMLSGALKYGGISAFVPLCDSGKTAIHNAPKTGAFDRAANVKGITVKTTSATVEELIQALE